MRDHSRDISRIAGALLLEGVLMAMGGMIALLWPNEVFLFAMLFAGSLLGLLAVYEIMLALHARSETRGWMLAAADGLAGVALAALTLTLTAIPYRLTLLLAAALLAMTGVLGLALALALWPMPRTRIVLLAWMTLNLALAVTALAYTSDIVSLLYTGAGYAIAYGLFHLFAGAWVRHFAYLELGPPVQRSWRPLGDPLAAGRRH